MKHDKKLLAYFKPQAESWQELKDMLPYGFEEKEVIDKYIENNAPFDDVNFK